MLDTIVTKNLLPYAFGVVLLGVVGLVFGEFALQWHFVPATVPYRSALAYCSAALLVVGGCGMLIRPTALRAALFTGCFLTLWAMAVHVPRVMADPGNVAIWLGLAEIGLLAVAGVTAWVLSRDNQTSPFAMSVAQRIFGVCVAIFALSHFVYADFTATLVPGWMPVRLFWAYATGTAHLAASLSLLTGIQARLASFLLATMLACFVLLVHVPRVIGDPTSQAEWGLLAAAMSMTGAAWIMRTSLLASSTRWRADERSPLTT